MSKESVTLQDIARKLGFTVSTVSKALRDYPDIGLRTKEQVQKLAKELNYSPNTLALKLRFQKTYILGVIIPEIVHHFFSNVITGIIEVAEENGYSVLLTQSNELVKREQREAKMLFGQQIDGLLISLSNETIDFKHLTEFKDHEIPVVQLDKINPEFASSTVQVDDFEGAYNATKHLIDKGYKRIAHIRGPVHPLNAIERFNGYKKALKDHSLPFYDSYVKTCEEVSESEGELFTHQLLELAQPPDAIFCITDLVAIGAMRAIKDRKLNIPKDIALIGFSDWQIASFVEPRLSSVFQPGQELGRVATEILLNEIKAKEHDVKIDYQHKVLKTHVVSRESA